jgi:glycosyltransferase involved in cell wall biosynthesis
VLKYADAVTVVSPGMQKEYSDRNDNVQVVMNGFDMADMEQSGGHDKPNGKFSLTYTGNFKPNQHVPIIWDGICELLAEHKDFENDFRIRFVGNLDSSVPDYFTEKGHSANLEIKSYVPHAEITRIMTHTDLLLFVVPQSRNNKLIITGKLFEYLASGTPIISVGPVDGDAAHILVETERKEMFDYLDKESFKQYLYQMYLEWKEKNGRLPQLDVSMLDKFSRRSSAKQISKIMQDIIIER